MDYIFRGLRIIVWSIAVFFYYFQVPFSEYSGLITAGLATFMILDIKNIFKIFFHPVIGVLYIATVAFCLISVLYSVSNGTELSSAIRFFLILILLPLCPFYKEKEANILYKIFSVLSLGKALMLIVIAFMVFHAGSHSEMREWALLNHYGDIYLGYGVIPRVQLKGNALLLIAFMISFYRNNRFTMYNIIVLMGILCAGNFAFILGLSVFFIWRYIQSLKDRTHFLKKICVGIILLVGMVGLGSYSIMESNMKSGYFGSNGMRIIQYEILTDTNIIYGSGLGSNVPGAVRLGRSISDQYYELQTLYIYYQVGIFCLIAFYILMFYTMRQSCNKDGLVLFFTYLFYSFFNPYCFDTTQIITMMLLSFEFSRNKNKD